MAINIFLLKGEINGENRSGAGFFFIVVVVFFCFFFCFSFFFSFFVLSGKHQNAQSRTLVMSDAKID